MGDASHEISHKLQLCDIHNHDYEQHPVTHLADINERAEELFFRLVNEKDITEQLKAQNQILWVQKMNNIHNRAMEIVNEELIYVLNLTADE